MRKWLSIALVLTAGSAAFAASSATFTGGRGDGSAHADYILPRTASSSARFLGGSRDGCASSMWRGYQPAAASAFARFAGAARDGYASAKFLSAWPQNPPRRFRGGSSDGYDSRAVRGLPNWAVGDTDVNGLPDWWELKYFGVLTGTNPNGDADHDGASNLFEYQTGTNPTNVVSYFHITRLTPGTTNKIFAYTAPAYFYTLQRSTNLALGWASVTNQIRISPAAEGVLEMDDIFSGGSGCYRILQEH